MSIIIFPLCVPYSSFNYPISSLTQKHCSTASTPSLAQHPTSWLLPCPQFLLPSSLPTSCQPFLNNFPLSSLYSRLSILHGTIMCFWEKKEALILANTPSTVHTAAPFSPWHIKPTIRHHLAIGEWSLVRVLQRVQHLWCYPANISAKLSMLIGRHSAFVWLLLSFSDILFWLRKKEMEEGVGLLSTKLLISCCRPQGGHINS